MSAAGEIKFGTSSFGASAHYTHHFSAKSHGLIAGSVGSTTLEIEVGGGRKISQFGTVCMLYSVGIQEQILVSRHLNAVIATGALVIPASIYFLLKGIFWRFELHRGGQKLIVPILVSRHLNAVIATGALVIPASIYFLLKVVKECPTFDLCPICLVVSNLVFSFLIPR